MSDLEVRAITHPKDTKAFVESWRYIYRDDPQWVPPITFERKSFFHPEKNPYFKVATVQCFMALNKRCSVLFHQPCDICVRIIVPEGIQSGQCVDNIPNGTQLYDEDIHNISFTTLNTISTLI